MSEASDQFRQLGKRLEDNDEPQYAAFCHLATGRCEQTIGNSPGEIEAITIAARSFLKSEMENHDLKNPSFEFQLTSAVASYGQASKLHEEQGRPQLAAGLNLEVAEAYWRMKRPIEALPYYQKAAVLSENDHMSLIYTKLKISSCYMAIGDYHNALLVLSDVDNYVSENDPKHLCDDIQENVEILRVLLLLIIDPSSHNTSPHLLNVIEKYREDEQSFEHDHSISEFISVEVSILLQSLVMAVDNMEVDSLLYIEDELVPLLTDQQKALLRVVVKQTIKKV